MLLAEHFLNLRTQWHANCKWFSVNEPKKIDEVRAHTPLVRLRPTFLTFLALPIDLLPVLRATTDEGICVTRAFFDHELS